MSQLSLAVLGEFGEQTVPCMAHACVTSARSYACIDSITFTVNVPLHRPVLTVMFQQSVSTLVGTVYLPGGWSRG